MFSFPHHSWSISAVFGTKPETKNYKWNEKEEVVWGCDGQRIVNLQ